MKKNLNFDCQNARSVMNFLSLIQSHHARVAELVDALDSGSSRSNPVEVRVLSRASLSGGKLHNLVFPRKQEKWKSISRLQAT